MLGSFCSFVVVKSVWRHAPHISPAGLLLPSPVCLPHNIIYPPSPRCFKTCCVCYKMFPGSSGRVRASSRRSSRPQSQQHTQHTRINPLVLHHSSPTTPPPSSIQSVSSVPSLQGAARKTTKIFDTPFWRVFFFLISPHTICAPPRTQLSSMYRRISFPPLAKARVVLGGCSLRPSRQASASEDAFIYTISV